MNKILDNILIAIFLVCAFLLLAWIVGNAPVVEVGEGGPDACTAGARGTFPCP